MGKDRGYVYIFTNPSFREDWIKIGSTKDVEDRLNRLSRNTNIPLPFEVYAVLETNNYVEVETLIFKLLDTLNPELRINKKREFFNIHPETAYKTFYTVKELLGDQAILELSGDNVEEFQYDSKNEKSVRVPDFTFASRGVKPGSIIKFVDDPSIEAVVITNKKVLFEEKEYSLSGLTRELYTRIGKVNKSGAYQGPAFFTYEGTKLTELNIVDENNN